MSLKLVVLYFGRTQKGEGSQWLDFARSCNICYQKKKKKKKIIPIHISYLWSVGRNEGLDGRMDKKRKEGTEGGTGGIDRLVGKMRFVLSDGQNGT